MPKDPTSKGSVTVSRDKEQLTRRQRVTFWLLLVAMVGGFMWFSALAARVQEPWIVPESVRP
jgi:hypothetical protein